MKLFELAAEDREIRFSPFVWRSKLSLAHKGLDYQSVPVRFLEKEPYAASGSKTVPVLEDDGRWISQSWNIACYLEDTYTDRPSLFGSAEGRALSRLVSKIVDRTLLPRTFLIIVADIPKILTDEDAAYFRRTREERIGASLDSTIERRPANLDRLGKLLVPFEEILTEQPFMCGRSPAYADYVLFAMFQWARLVSPIELIARDSRLDPWRNRMLDLFDGLAARAKGISNLQVSK